MPGALLRKNRNHVPALIQVDRMNELCHSIKIAQKPLQTMTSWITRLRKMRLARLYEDGLNSTYWAQKLCSRLSKLRGSIVRCMITFVMGCHHILRPRLYRMSVRLSIERCTKIVHSQSSISKGYKLRSQSRGWFSPTFCSLEGKLGFYGVNVPIISSIQ